MTNRFSRNGKPTTETGEYAKNEVDTKLDRLTEYWLKLEKKLLTESPRCISCNYSTTEHDPDDGPSVEENRYLGIQRCAGKWRICHAVTWKAVASLPWKPISECDHETRMEATNGVVQLEHAVRATRTRFIPELDAAIKRLENALFDNGED